MKPIITITTQYGFAHYWTLIAFGRSFYLGQDVKFCDRVLNMLPREVAKAIGSAELYKEKVRQDLAQFICDRLNITKETVGEFESWSICAE